MRVRRLGYAPLAMVLAAIGGGTQLGCSSEDCSGVSCALPGVSVHWATDALPAASTVELCFDGSCEPVEPWQAGGLLHVMRPVEIGAERPNNRRLDVVLVVTTSEGRIERRGSGRLADGGCCLGTSLQVDGDRLRR